jgi:DNA-binding HxlR family transcriptional regulator
VSLRKTGFSLRGVDPETTLKVQDSLIEFGKTMFPVWTLSRWEIEYLGRGFKNNFSKTNY